jgi:hypothetical protein
MNWLLSVQNVSTIASHAIFAAKGAVAGCSEVIEVGLCATARSSTAVYSAKLGLSELHTRNTHLVENMIVQTRVGHGLLDKRPHGAASVRISCEIRRHSSFCRIRCKRTYVAIDTAVSEEQNRRNLLTFILSAAPLGICLVSNSIHINQSIRWIEIYLANHEREAGSGHLIRTQQSCPSDQFQLACDGNDLNSPTDATKTTKGRGASVWDIHWSVPTSSDWWQTENSSYSSA